MTKILDFIKDFKNNKYIYLLMLPAMIFMLIFSYFPMNGYILAFKDFNMAKGIFGSTFIGFENFKFFFMGKDWLPVTINTVLLNSLFIFFGMGFAVVLALIINEFRSTWFKRIIQSGVFLPYFVSWLVISQMVYALFATDNGMINQILMQIGLQKVSFYISPQYWRFILTFIYIWKFSGYLSVIFIGSISSIDPSYYESAVIDGASRLQMALHITLPLIKKTILMMVLLSIGRIFYGDFGMIYGLVGDNSMLYSATDVIDTYSYRAMRFLGNFGMSSAITLYQSFLGVLAVIAFNRIGRAVDPEARLF